MESSSKCPCGVWRSMGLLSLCCLTLGCGWKDDVSMIVPVAGTITVHGKPVANVRVQFQPVGGASSSDLGLGSLGITDASGQYRLRLIDVKRDLDGAVVGRHRVHFSTADPDANPDAGLPVRSVLPKGFEGREDEFEVPTGGTDQANFSFP